MKIPRIRGIIDRRLLVNFRVDPEVMARNLPAPFRPKLVRAAAIAGICLIRLKAVRPRFVPAFLGIRSENAAHRIAVEWDGENGTEEGVFIPRRDSDSLLSQLLGGRIFPGVHHRAHFVVSESAERYRVDLTSSDGETHLSVEGTVARELPADSVFENLAEASEFFERGSLGYSVTREAGTFDGLELRTDLWKVEALDVSQVESSYFQKSECFPADSVQFDHALLMKDIEHEWVGRAPLCCPAAD